MRVAVILRKLGDEYRRPANNLLHSDSDWRSSTVPLIDQRGTKLHDPPRLALIAFSSAFLFGLHLLHRLSLTVRRLVTSQLRAILCSPFVGLHNAAQFSPLTQTVPSRAMPTDQACGGLRQLSSAYEGAPRLANNLGSFLCRCPCYKAQFSSRHAGVYQQLFAVLK